MSLELVPLQELYDELLSRFDHIIIIGLKVKDKDKEVSRRWKGSHHFTMGLCGDMSNLIWKDWMDNQHEIETEDL